jgi:hypothetical protein
MCSGYAVYLYLGSAWFESRRRHRLFRDISLFSSVPSAKFRDSTAISTPPFPSNSFPVHYSSIILKFDTFTVTKYLISYCVLFMFRVLITQDSFPESKVGMVFPVIVTIQGNVDTIGFRRWCITHRNIGFSDFVHRPDFFKYQWKNTTFRKLDLFPSSGEGRHLLCWVP